MHSRLAVLGTLTLCAFAGQGLPCSRVVVASGDVGLTRFEIPAYHDASLSAYPTVDRLPDGRLLCVFSTRESASGSSLLVVGAVSSDLGRSWSAPEPIINTPDWNDYDPSIVVVGGHVYVTATTTPRDVPGITTSRIMTVRSDDNGRTWSAPYEIPTGRRYTSGKVHRGIVLRDGTALLGFTWEKNLELGPAERLDHEGEMEEVNAVLISYDQGRTWASSQSVELLERRPDDGSNAINGVCEPALVECPDGSIYMLARTGLKNLYGSRSYDQGRSWSPPRPTPLAGHNAPAALCALNDGSVVAVWNDSPTNRWPLAAAISRDGCRSWSKPRILTDGDGQQCSYPGCIVAADGDVVAVYQQQREDRRSILGVKFSPSWITELDAPANQDAPVDDRGAESAGAPRQLAHFESMPKPVTLPDGTLAALFLEHEGPGLPPTPAQQSVRARYSRDDGETWSEPESLLDLPAEAGGFGYFVPLVDRHGEIHLFLLCDANTGVNRPRPPGASGPAVEPLARQRLDVWHVQSEDARRQWSTPRPIWTGRAADLQSATQLSGGRLILPLSYLVERSWSNRGEGPDAFSYAGQFDTTVLYSDDHATWQRSATTLRTPTPNLSAYGAVEPTVLELNDGRVWMLLRTQMGRFYESFSHDQGATWSAATPSSIVSSDSPAALTRLPDGRIVMLWNHCQRHPYAQGSRHVLHAAVSHDEGTSWRGYREVYRDPARRSPPPPNGDHGVSYPFATAARDGSILYSLWVQSGNGRSLLRFHPDWLEATTASDDFSQGLKRWSTFGARGVDAAPHPDDSAQQVLQMQRTDPEWPTAAVWNFPTGDAGRIRMRIRVESNSPPICVALTNHFSPPFDAEAKLHSLFHTSLTFSESGTGAAVAPGAWADVELVWDCNARNCRVMVDGIPTQVLHQQHAGPGPSYLRLSLEEHDDRPGAILLERVAMTVGRGGAAGEQRGDLSSTTRTSFPMSLP